MTVKKSENITNVEASVLLDKKIAVQKVVIDKVALATTDIDASDIIHMGPIPSNAVITSIKLFNDDLDSNGSPTLAANVGLYYADGTVISAACIATAITTLQASNVVGAEVRFEAANITTVDSEAWALGGLSVDPGGMFYVSLTISNAAATAAAGDVVMVIEYM